MERRPPDAVALHLDEVPHRGVAEADRVRLPFERAIRARRALLDRGPDEAQGRGVEAPVLPQRLLGERARGGVARVGRGGLLGEQPAHGENAPVGRDGGAVLELLERLHPADGPAPHGHVRCEERVRLREPERPFEEDLRLVVDVERRERAQALQGKTALHEGRGAARHGLVPRDLEVDGRFGKGAREPRAAHRRAGDEDGEADGREARRPAGRSAPAGPGRREAPRSTGGPSLRGPRAREEPCLQEVAARTRARLHAAVDRLDPDERIRELVDRPVQAREVRLVEDERMAVRAGRAAGPAFPT